jgi:hypothetical protein
LDTLPLMKKGYPFSSALHDVERFGTNIVPRAI